MGLKVQITPPVTPNLGHKCMYQGYPNTKGLACFYSKHIQAPTTPEFDMSSEDVSAKTHNIWSSTKPYFIRQPEIRKSRKYGETRMMTNQGLKRYGLTSTLLAESYKFLAPFSPLPQERL